MKMEIRFLNRRTFLQEYDAYMDKVVAKMRTKHYQAREDIFYSKSGLVNFYCRNEWYASMKVTGNETQNAMLLTALALQAYKELSMACILSLWRR